MAGHSKWANIKHRKDRADALKGKLFSKLAKEIISAVKLGGPDPKANSRLRLAIQQAKIANMPSENVERNIKKASSSDQADYIEMVYEFYGYGGVGLVVETMTDNKNRLSSDMRIATNKKGGTIATPGSVTFNFDRKGVIQVKSVLEEDKVFEAALEAGAENFESAEEEYMITTDPAKLFEVKEGLEKKGIACTAANIEWIPKVVIECEDQEMRESNLALVSYLEALDDVNAVYHNMAC